MFHDDVIKWKHIPRYWPFVRGIHRSPVNSPHKDQWRGALPFSFICVWINSCVNNRKAGDLRRNPAHYCVSVMSFNLIQNINDAMAWKYFLFYIPFVRGLRQVAQVTKQCFLQICTWRIHSSEVVVLFALVIHMKAGGYKNSNEYANVISVLYKQIYHMTACGNRQNITLMRLLVIGWHFVVHMNIYHIYDMIITLM